ncbi:Uncharacterised protein [Metakosakonia massiliensis]|uniref:Uncharacterized protein YoaI n=1 Tax=Phytobacter massiliensis TaxID=1485952 RepID=A0A6N3GAH2_9ENTR
MSDPMFTEAVIIFSGLLAVMAILVISVLSLEKSGWR